MPHALLVIDVQNEYFGGLLPATHSGGSLNNILRAMDAAQERGLPAVVVQHAAPVGSPVFVSGSPTWGLHPQVASRPHDLLLAKHLPGSFTNTGLEDWLKARGIGAVVITGYMTQMCCDTTARQTFHRGFDVEFLGDATGTLAIDNYAGSFTAEELAPSHPGYPGYAFQTGAEHRPVD